MSEEHTLRETGPIALAFVGDSVFDLFIRERIVRSGIGRPKDLQQKASGYARAESQAAMIRDLFEELSEEEQDVVRRARNAKVHTMPKHAGVMEYKMATGLEALIGYLYLSGRNERLGWLLERCMEVPLGEKENG